MTAQPATDWWSEQDRTERLIKHWNDGMSSGQIFRIIGAQSRSAVVGKVHRLRLAGVEMRRAPPPRPPGTVITFTRRRDNRPSGPPKAPKVQAPPPPPPPSSDMSQALPWTERRFGQCAFPVAGEGADTLSCCQPVKDEAPYCAFHCRIVYAPVKPRARRIERLARYA